MKFGKPRKNIPTENTTFNIIFTKTHKQFWIFEANYMFPGTSELVPYIRGTLEGAFSVASTQIFEWKCFRNIIDKICKLYTLLHRSTFNIFIEIRHNFRLKRIVLLHYITLYTQTRRFSDGLWWFPPPIFARISQKLTSENHFFLFARKNSTVKLEKIENRWPSPSLS